MGVGEVARPAAACASASKDAARGEGSVPSTWKPTTLMAGWEMGVAGWARDDLESCLSSCRAGGSMGSGSYGISRSGPDLAETRAHEQCAASAIDTTNSDLGTNGGRRLPLHQFAFEHLEARSIKELQLCSSLPKPKCKVIQHGIHSRATPDLATT